MIRVYQHLNICDVCRLLDGDQTPKVCAYCRLCDSMICEKDQNDWWRRGLAAVKRKFESNYKGDPNYRTN